jgi:hypothetical protein
MDLSRIQTVTELGPENLFDLLEDHLCLLIVKAFADPLICRHVANYLRASAEIQPYTHETQGDEKLEYVYLGVDRIGVPFNSTLTRLNPEEASRIYYDSALKGIREVRQGCHPFLSPIDQLRLELDEIYPSGTNIAAFEGRKMFVGIARLMKAARSAASQEVPHFDALPRSICDLSKQFAANVFLAVPEQDGELEVWDVQPLDPNDTLPTDWRDRAEQALTVKPEVGDLIFFNSRRPHAVREFKSGDRISLQCFIGVQGGSPLLLWN